MYGGYAQPMPIDETAPPPHNFEIEIGLLAALLADNRTIERVSEVLFAEHFADPLHGRIYDAIVKLVGAGRQANSITLRAYLERDEDLSRLGGPQYLGQLQATAITIVNVPDYAERIVDLYRRRVLVTIGRDIVLRARQFVLGESALDQVAIAESALFELAEHHQSWPGPIELGRALGQAIDIADAAFRRGGRVAGVTTGLAALDDILGGLQPADLVILAAPPSMGKTALALNIAINAATANFEWRQALTATSKAAESGVSDGAVVAFFSLEMSADQLANRVLAERSEIRGDLIRRGELRGEDFIRFAQASSVLCRLPLYIDDTPALTLSAIRTRVRRMKRTLDVGLIVIDYLQLIASSPGARSENGVQEISAITRGLKALAKELGVPVLALSQLSRAVELREDKRPLLSDLRESGTIEQDADVVLFVYREHYYLRSKAPERRSGEPEREFNNRFEEWKMRLAQVEDKAELIVAKHRQGETGTILLRFEPRFTRFSDASLKNDE